MVFCEATAVSWHVVQRNIVMARRRTWAPWGAALRGIARRGRISDGGNDARGPREAALKGQIHHQIIQPFSGIFTSPFGRGGCHIAVMCRPCSGTGPSAYSTQGAVSGSIEDVEYDNLASGK